MVVLVETIDAISRRLGRDVLLLTCTRDAGEARNDAKKWLAEKGFEFTDCLPFADGYIQFEAPASEVYIDLVYDPDSDAFQEIDKYFEHTDGLNYENIELTRYLDLWFNDKGNVDFNGQIGVAIGALVPRSNVLLMGEGTDEFHLAGFGTSATAGVMLTLFKNWVLQYKVKGGYMNMPDIVTNGSKNPERVKQSFWFLERFFTVGANIPIKGKKKLID